jgi:hypothetical protein
MQYFFFFPNLVQFMRYRGKIWQSQTSHKWQYNTGLHIVWLRLETDTRICNSYCFSAAKMVTRKPFNITLYVRCLSFYMFILAEACSLTNKHIHPDTAGSQSTTSSSHDHSFTHFNLIWKFLNKC